MLHTSYLSCVAACLYSADVFARSIMPHPFHLAVLLATSMLTGCAASGGKPVVQPQAMACDALPAELEAAPGKSPRMRHAMPERAQALPE